MSTENEPLTEAGLMLLTFPKAVIPQSDLRAAILGIEREAAERATRQVAAPEPHEAERALNRLVPLLPSTARVHADYNIIRGAIRAAAQGPEQARLDHTCSESCLHDCAACGHEVDHGPTFHAPDCLAKLTWPDQGPEQARREAFEQGRATGTVEGWADYTASEEHEGRCSPDDPCNRCLGSAAVQHDDEYDALARQLHESIAEGQTVALTAKALRILGGPEQARDSGVKETRREWLARILAPLIHDGHLDVPGGGDIPDKAFDAAAAIDHALGAAHEERGLDAIIAALTSEDEIGHGEAFEPSRGGLGVCAYCDGEWPCRTQRGIERLLARLAATPAPSTEKPE